ncbi:hypothetical protein F5X99DRAFT_430146 [Biscogniauxia marginata]|nr:hypothetical protein F5X99DRAFT_430146 [Biscogniauxia marginata]
MPEPLQKALLRCAIRRRIYSMAQLQNFMFYHLDLLACGSWETREDYPRIRRFYLDILGISVDYLRGKMWTKSLEDLDRDSFDERIMGKSGLKIRNSIPKANTGQGVRTTTETNPLPGTENTDLEESNMMNLFGITSPHEPVEHTKVFTPSDGLVTSSSSSTPIFQPDEEVESERQNDSIRSWTSQSKGAEGDKTSKDESLDEIN